MAQPAKQRLLQDPVVRRVRNEVRRLYGDRVVRLVLYGSRARGDGGPDSDYDFAAFFRDPVEADGRIAQLETRIFQETGALASLFLFPLSDLAKETLYMEAVRQEGVPLLSGAREQEMERARKHLERARRIAAAGEPAVAAREAYLAALSAARAYIFERTGKVVKTHAGARSRFAELAAGEGLAAGLAAFLAQGFELKQAADYDAGREADPGQAQQAIVSAEEFLRAIETALTKD